MKVIRPAHAILLSVLTLSLLATACKSTGDTKDDAQVKQPASQPADITERMATEHANDEPIENDATKLAPRQPVVGEEVVYGTLDGVEIKGYLTMPEGADPSTLPALVVIHEWWGLNDNIRKMTDRLAGEGYVALAVDLYGGSFATEPAKAKELMSSAMSKPEAAKANLDAAIAYLDAKQTGKLGVIGWCFGGGWSLQTAINAPGAVDAAVIYYGRVGVEKDQLAPIDAPILGIFGSEDKGIPVESVKAFEANLGELDKDASIHIYEGADHAFANPSGTRYQAEAAEDAWARTTAFFAKHLGAE